MSIGFDRKVGSGIVRQGALVACRKAIRNLNDAKSCTYRSERFMDLIERMILSAEVRLISCILLARGRQEWVPGARSVALNVDGVLYVVAGSEYPDEFDTPRLIIIEE